jgi:2-methylcitrate dehydratase PrpD
MTLVMDDGSEHVSQVDYPKGSIQNSMNDAELRTKFDSLVVPVLGAERAARLATLAGYVEDCGNVAELMAQAVPAPATAPEAQPA